VVRFFFISFIDHFRPARAKMIDKDKESVVCVSHMEVKFRPQGEI
jgi:hypothetical protein